MGFKKFFGAVKVGFDAFREAAPSIPFIPQKVRNVTEKVGKVEDATEDLVHELKPPPPVDAAAPKA